VSLKRIIQVYRAASAHSHNKPKSKMPFPGSSMVDTIERDAAAAGSLLTRIARVRFGSRLGHEELHFVKCKHDHLDRISHAIVIMTTESCPRYFGFQAAIFISKAT
jgi:hypothetical protein